ncbi:MAG TPA: SusC/RagA family TonB-linked outer membrane protein [Puia sp.]|nr:SusC/RagA family TonB-linked outer membrane protein [Puia sp.]
MKLTSILLLGTCLQVSARVHSQTVSFSGKNVSLEKVFASVEKQTGYVFFFDEAILQDARPVTIRVDNMPLAFFLNTILKEEPLTFSFQNKTIVIFRRQPLPVPVFQPLDTSMPLHPPAEIRGHVTDSAGYNPLSGASVAVKGTKKVVSTNEKGDFTITGLNGGDHLLVSYVGYETKEIILDERGVHATMYAINIRLTHNNNPLDDLVVIGYGTTTRRVSTGSISKVSSAELSEQPVSNPILALEGRVPGLFITQGAGYAGANMTVSIRGMNSLNLTSNAPLYVIDGIPFGSTPVEQSAGAFLGAAGFSPLNTINPADIESISILKDADATAIYGSRGASGVILITTKKGKTGNTKFNVDLSSGDGKVTRMMPMLNTAQYLSVRRQAFANDGVTPTAANAPDLTLWSQTQSTNFPKLLIGNTAHQANAALSLSGGDAFNQFLFSGNYHRESTVFKTNTADKIVQFHLNAQHKSHDNKFGASVSVNYNIDNNTIPNYSLSIVNYGLPPNYPLYNANGSLYFGTGYTNPLAAFNANYNMQSTNLITNAGFHYTLLPGLDFKTSLGYNLIDSKGTLITPTSASNPLSNAPPTSQLSDNYIKTYIAEPTLDYTYVHGKGKLTALAGGTWQETQSVQPYFVLGTYTNPRLATSLAALTVLLKSSGYSDYKYESGFGRLSYEWDGKYLVSGNIRRDGSSRFGADRQFGNFGSIAGAWIFSMEPFAQKLFPWLSFGKIKTSYGTIGNDRIADYSYEAIYSNVGTSYGSIAGIAPSRIANPYIQWEVTKKLDAAIELGFLKDRLFFSADFYRNRSGNLLGYTPLPSQAGFSSYTNNLPGLVQNKGVELELTSTNIKSRSFTWSTSVNVTIPQNKLLSFPNLKTSTYANTYVVGQSLNMMPAYHFTGFNNGIATVEDVNKDGVITSGLAANGKGDVIIAGNTDPKIYGGLNNTFRYKGFQLDILFQGVKRRGYNVLGTAPGKNYNMPAYMLNIPFKYTATSGTAASTAYNYYAGSDAAIGDVSFIRLKNVSLSYNVPAKLIKQLKMETFQLYIHGQNMLTITHYKGLDPETQGMNLPPLKMLIAGIRITF